MRSLVRRLWYLVRRRQREADLAEEMAFHREMSTRDLIEGGLGEDEAALGARRRLGSLALARDQARDVWIWAWLQDAVHDFRVAARLVGTDRVFTSAVVIVLALGIGAANTIEVLMYAICLRGLPIDSPDRVMFIASRDARAQDAGLSFPDFQEARARTPGLTAMAAFASTPAAVSAEGQTPDRALAMYDSADTFRLLGERPVLGRDFTPDDDRPGAEAVVILSGGLWRSRYGGDPSIIGRALRVNGTPATVVGIMRHGFRFPSTTDVWQPLAQMPGLAVDRRGARTLSVMARLGPGTSLADIRGQLDTAAASLAREYPDSNRDVRFTVVPINERYNGRVTDTVWLSFISVGVIVLLIACANAANLLLMRAVQRGHEMATRASLGATRSRLVRQLLMESAWLGALGGIAGLACSWIGLRALGAIVPPDTLAYWITFTIDKQVLAALCVGCLATVFLFGLAPALHLSRTDVHQAMKEGGRTGSSSRRAGRWTTAFLTAEFALTMILLAGCCLGIINARKASRADRVLRTGDVLTTWISLPADRYGAPARRTAFFEQLDRQIETIALVPSAAVATALPLGGAAMRQLVIDGPSPIAGEVPPTLGTVGVSPRYFETLGVPVQRGRPFASRDGSSGHESAIVNQRFADLYFPGTDPLGRRIRLLAPNAANAAAPWMSIVGVSATVRQRATPDADAIVYVPLQAAPPATAVVMLRAGEGTGAVAPLLREKVRALDPIVPLYRVMPLEQALAQSQWNTRISEVILNGLTFVAMLLAAVGLYAVTAHFVGQREKEIGIRVALGARPRRVVAMIARRAAVQLTFGLAAGLACIVAWTHLFGDQGLQAPAGARMDDPLVLVAVAIGLAAVAAAACILPARRAACLDPAGALRND